MRRIASLACMLLFAVSCSDPPSEVDRAELIGPWLPDDGSGRIVQFKADGVFDYHYFRDTILRLDWKLERKGKVSLRSGNGVTKACYYTVRGNSLSIDDGSSRECVRPGVTPPSPMPKKFTRAG